MTATGKRYLITHVTSFDYDTPVSESHMELRMQPASGEGQTCLRYDVRVDPRARPHSYHDHFGNAVDAFSVPHRHQSLTITATAEVVVEPPESIARSLDTSAWRLVDEWAAADAHWDMRHPSNFAVWTPALAAYAESIPAARDRAVDPLSSVREITAAVHRDFEYAPNTTTVDSTIDEVLAVRRGVCQDLSHVAVALLRRLNLPARYVSGYIAPVIGDATTVASSGATHAWVEVLLPGLGWVGFDPTNDVEAGDRHVRVAVGRDYADVPPTRGVYKGGAASTLTVAIVFERVGDTFGGNAPATTVSRSFTPMSAPAAFMQRRSAQEMQQQQ
jgi:transglutaminase-like putative cysteine protease